MRPLLIAATLACLSCPGPTDPPDTDVDTDTDTDTDVDTDTDTDVDRCEPDEDGDGWCPPEDCDDTSIFVNPSWTENPTDGIDNNCDGRIDEVFERVFILEWDVAASRTSLIHFDALGDLRGTYNTGGLFFPTTASLDHDLRRFIVWDTPNLTLWSYDLNGAIRAVASIPEDYEWPDADGESDPPPIIGDLVAHPDGYYLVAAGDRLLRFNTDGSFSTVAQWDCVEDDGSHELCAIGVGVDRVWGTVMLFGYFGGIGRWTPTDGIEILQASDPDEPGPRFLQTHYKPFDTWYSLGIYFDEEASRMTYGVFRYNRETQQKVLLGTWPDPAFQPNAFSIEEISGDFYFSVNSPRGARGAYHNQVWRMSASGNTTAILYQTRPEVDTNYYVGVGVHYDHK